jgi:hypothetical protein
MRADSTGSFEEAIESGKFGEKGAGIQDLVCGGMHSLMIDEKGRVSFCNPPTLSVMMLKENTTGLVMGSERWGSSRPSDR